MGHFDNIVLENVFASSCAKGTGRYWCGIVLFQGKVESVGHVAIRNLRRVDGEEFRNDIPTVNIGNGVRIDTLILDDVEQRVPDGKPLIVRGPDAKIRNLVVREGGVR